MEVYYEIGSQWGTCSLVDAKAHSDILLHPSFVPYLKKGVSIQLIMDIFTKTQTREWKKEMEPIRPVHSPWVEITKEDNIQWEPDKHDNYWGSRGGAPAGPSAAALLVARTTKSLLSLFLFMVPLTFFSQVAK